MIQRLIAAIGLAACMALAHGASVYPDRPIRLIVPYTPGGNTDLLGRMIAQRLGESTGQTVVVENRPGAAGTIGVDAVAKAKPDGYTMVLASFGNILTAAAWYKTLPYDPVADLAPVALLATPQTVLVANPKLPFNDVKGLIAYAKANPGKLNYGSSGSGSSNHLFGALFASMAHIDMTHVPYKGSGPAINDVMAGTIQLSFAPFPLVIGQIATGRLKALAVTGATRHPLLPHTPTVAEAGVPGYEALGWFALMVPAGTPKPLIDRLNVEVNRILKLPEVKASLAQEGAEPVGGTPEAARRSITEGVKKWGGLVNKLGITP
ncbi:tripartite tricarboxylate transporter substrate binding protein [Paralcaligenes sp. KSB-10]|jgi:tripartite-type tricarboxylate transporter receptor subunit TctC|uniref:Bug family tripartite tricarboxylate transporter substrate binding protein n=1 Tax=Paralcaligenes sp. KSB-10 TaxID=2901142 RepID=UPI001E2A529D|nr:tripartite tricarboxylate transporter substrate binding protein [Paralcaligenes sp. KSB-10]UHL64368.1 tripartite tricarboxylate transporter substrate binding protein [Paralcaligenes sp. KSB-10]